MKIDFKNSEQCMHLSYKEAKDNMTIDDAIYILSKRVNEYHKATKSGKEKDLMYLPRPWIVRAFEIALECMKRYKDSGEVIND